MRKEGTLSSLRVIVEVKDGIRKLLIDGRFNNKEIAEMCAVHRDTVAKVKKQLIAERKTKKARQSIIHLSLMKY
jgi:DNA invertase Pin-like site-specific DNA recombinase